jgi:hypothetical protein
MHTAMSREAERFGGRLQLTDDGRFTLERA